MITARDLADQFSFSVSEEIVRAPRRLYNLMAGPTPTDEFVSNGCGPKLAGSRAGKIISWLVPDRMCGWDFLLPCHFHDYAYDLGGGRLQRREADFNLSRNIFTSIAESRNTLSAPVVFTVALCFWWGVRAGGWCAFDFKQRLDRGVTTKAHEPSPRTPMKAAIALPRVAMRLAAYAIATS